MNLKKLLVALLFVQIAITGISTIYAQEKKSQPTKLETMKCWASMDCSSCQEKIEKNIPFEKGVTGLQVDLPTKMVTVTYKPGKTTPEKIEKALQKLGFETEIIKEKK